MEENTSYQETVAVGKNDKKPKWLAITLFVLSMLYLFPEAVFNAKLVSVAGGATVTDTELHLVELFGRTISGIGVTLLIADLLLKGRLTTTWLRTLSSFFCIALVVWPTVFFGQKILVDKLLVEPSTAQQRQEAFFASVLRGGLALNAINIEGIPYEPDNATKPSEMTFLALMGGLVYANNDFLHYVEDKKSIILERYITNRAAAKFDEHYGKYRDLRNQVQKAWTNYSSGVERYNNAISSGPKEADKAWETVETTIADGWKKYKKAEKTYLARAEARAQEVAPKIYDHFDDKNRCIDRYQDVDHPDYERRDSCIRSVVKDYTRTLEKASIPFKPMDYWLTIEKGRIRGRTTIMETVQTLGVSALLSGLEILAGEGGNQVEKKVFSNRVSNYTPKILVLWMDKFKKETGYPMGIDSLKEFRRHPVTAKKVRTKMRSHNIILPKSWKITHISAFKKAVNKRVRKEANVAWAREVQKQGIDFKPNLTWTQFQKTDAIQGRIKDAMGERYYVKPVMANWNNKQFYQHVIVPNITKERDYWLSYIEAARTQFEDGGPLAEKGKSALRSIIVPPISMSLSLLLVILTALKLPMKLFQLVNYDKPKPPATKKSKVVGLSISLGIIAVVIVVPLVMFSSKYTERESTVGYFVDKVEETLSPAATVAVRWVLHTQPIIQPIGASIDAAMRITHLFGETMEHAVGEFDVVVMSKINSSINQYENQESTQAIIEQVKKATQSGVLTEYPFEVTTNTSNANIRIMNIKPRFRQGMKLPVGNYDIEVSAPGFMTIRKWVSHKKGKTQHHFKLAPVA